MREKRKALNHHEGCLRFNFFSSQVLITDIISRSHDSHVIVSSRLCTPLY